MKRIQNLFRKCDSEPEQALREIDLPNIPGLDERILKNAFTVLDELNVEGSMIEPEISRRRFLTTVFWNHSRSRTLFWTATRLLSLVGVVSLMTSSDSWARVVQTVHTYEPKDRQLYRIPHDSGFHKSEFRSLQNMFAGLFRGNKPQSIRFLIDYSKQGLVDIYALGVHHLAKLIDRVPNDDLKLASAKGQWIVESFGTLEFNQIFPCTNSKQTGQTKRRANKNVFTISQTISRIV